MKVLVTAILALALSGCSFTPHDVQVDLGNQSARMNAAAVGIPIFVAVTDERDSELIGQRDAIGAKITGTQLLPKLTVAVKEIFEDKGYKLVDESRASAMVAIKLRGVTFEYTMGLLTGGQHVSVTLSVRARKSNDGSSEYEKIYRSQEERRRFVVAFGDEIDQRLADHMNAVLGQMATDEALHAYLTST